MPAGSENKYLQSLLDDLVTSHETEINYSPFEVELDPQYIKENDLPFLLEFVQEKRKRLFIFKLANDAFNSSILAFTARRAILNQTAEILLKSTSTEPKINSLKEALNNPATPVRASIQIQKSIPLPKPKAAVLNRPLSEQIEQTPIPDLVLVPIDLPEFPVLSKQLAALGIRILQDTALLKIKEHADAFTDGIIPGNLPKGFYIDYKKYALCYTNNPHRLPSALAPILEKPTQLAMPTLEQSEVLLPKLSKTILAQLLNSADTVTQKNALIGVLPTYAKELSGLVSILKPDELDFIVPLLAKLFIFGGEAHTKLFIKFLRNCLNKKINIEFLKDPVAQNSFLSPRGIKNLQKLLELSAEQKEWWNTLANAHLKNQQHHFDFNNFFETYSQIFLPRIAEKNLTLPNPCPIEHNGHFLITLNRVLDVLELAQNPQEQCLSLAGLNWGPTGAHYAMAQAPKPQRFKQVTPCMNLESPGDTELNPLIIYTHIHDNVANLKIWLFRYLGQHWKAGIRLTDIQAQFEEIQGLQTWSVVEKNQLMFILTSTFPQSTLTAESWQKTLKNCINLLQAIGPTERTDLLHAISHCFQFKPNPTLIQIQGLLVQATELKTAFPSKNFKNELLTPLFSCLENEGFELINTLQERVQKVHENSNGNEALLSTIISFTTLLQKNRQNLHSDAIRILATLDESDLTQSKIDDLMLSIKTLKEKRSAVDSNAFLSLLGKINISKSQPLPNAQQIQELINAIADSSHSIPDGHDNLEKKEKWFKDFILEKNLLPGCVFGNGDISKLDDLIVDALVDAVKKRSSVLKVDKLKASLTKNLQSKLVPEQLKEQLNEDLLPLFDALNELVILLQTPNPKFEDILEKLRFFEEKKPRLLDATYSVGLLGKSKGDFLLSYILTGKRKATDNETGAVFGTLLTKLHGVINDEINGYFNDEQNKNAVTDLDAKTCLEWLVAFNQTHSLTFLFKEELVQKKVIPALTKTLQQLNTQDSNFENSILEAAANLAEDQSADKSLQNYKNTIEAIVSYLNFLIDIKDKASAQFHVIYKQLHTGPLGRLNYTQKQTLINNLFRANPQSFERYLKLTIQALEENPIADATAINRAISGLVPLFELSDLESETQTMFFNMSMAHNLRSTSPFPLAVLNELKKSNLEEQAKSVILKQIIQILSRMTEGDSQDLIQDLVQQTQSFLTQNSEQAALCISLLKRVSLDNLSRDLSTYSSILSQLAPLKPENRGQLTTILTGLASSKKDDTVNLPTLLDIAKGLGRRSAVDLGQVMQLFATPPYPIAHTLNTALLAHGSEKLQAYCLSFDTNPFAKTGETRPLAEHFATNRIKDALLSLKDLLNGVELPHALQLKLARQLTYIETLGYTDPLNPNDYTELKKLTAISRQELQERACTLLHQLRSNHVPAEQIELTHMELLAYLREIYFRTTGLFPNTTQMLMLQLSLQEPYTNLLMRINTGEGKSLITPILAVLQWTQGGTVDVCTANRTLLGRDYENSCEPFFKFLGIKSALIQDNSNPKDYQLGGINCSTLEDMALFRLAAKETKQEALIQNDEPIHLVLDESDDALLDQTTLYKLVAETSQAEAEDIHAQWIYPLAYQFINLPMFRNTDPTKGKVWDEDEDLEQFRLYINKEINEKFNGDADKQNFMLATSNTQLKQWINASCKAAKLVENKHFIVRPIKEKDETGNEVTKKIVCIPLVRSTLKTGCIFTDGVQQALQARLNAECQKRSHHFAIDADPPVLASQSARGLVGFYQDTGGRLVGISGTPGDWIELQYLTTQLGTQAIGVAPYAGDHRKIHPPVFTFSRDDTIYAIHNAIEAVKRPVTNPRLEFDSDIPIQTLEERESFILQTKDALEKWSQTQTQPILIVSEDFDDAQAIGRSFKAYKKAGFKIQIVTGKESPEELEKIIKQAGRANTITIGTAMLARGIDINPGNHPEGLFVIQTYPDSERMTTQIAGRAARNGKPGQWLPIYQLPSPKSWFTKLMYFLFPNYRQHQSEKAIATLQSDIKLQATLDRLYTQAIDQAQQTLMQQVYAWESLLLDLYPSDVNLRHELYQWREMLLSELAHAQETSITQNTLESSVTQFQNTLCKIWEKVREEKWVAKARKASVVTQEQNLRVNYLSQLDLAKELNIQAALQEKALPFKASVTTLMHQNVETIILDKAGAVLEYTTPEEKERKDLELAQNRQLLPYFIGEFCAVHPEAVEKLNSAEQTQSSSFLSGILKSLADKIIKQKNKVLRTEDTQQITKSIIEFYQKKLNTAEMPAIQELLEKIKPLILNHSQALAKTPLTDRFKIQGLVLTFIKLYQQSGLAPDEQLNELKTRYDDEIMKMLAEYLLNEFSWVNKSPQPIHAFLERTIAKEAAQAIYLLADEVRQSPSDEAKIQALYTGLQEHRVKLLDKRLFSIRHNCPRDVINMALTAIDALEFAPHCDRAFQESCHDTVLSKYHIAQFRVCLENTSRQFHEDIVWEHLKATLANLSENNNQVHLIEELYETVERYGSYPVYQPYKSSIKTLKAQLADSIKVLREANGLKQDTQESLLTEKASQFASLFNVAAEQVRIQKGCDGIQSYVEVQIENAPLQEDFTGYQSSFLAGFEKERSSISQQKMLLHDNREALINLSDVAATKIFPSVKRMALEKLFRLKTLLNLDWSEGLDNSFISELPQESLSIYHHIQRLKHWDWAELPEFGEVEKILGQDPRLLFADLLDKHIEFKGKLKEIQARKLIAKQIVEDKRKQIAAEEEKIVKINERLRAPECSFGDTILLNGQILTIKTSIAIQEKKLSDPLKNLAFVTEEERVCQESLNQVVQDCISKTVEVISSLEKQAKNLFNQHLIGASKAIVDTYQQELEAMDSTVEQLNQVEIQKSRYQTRRFFNSRELLKYEASLRHEEALIPREIVSANVHPAGFARFFRQPIERITTQLEALGLWLR